MGLIPPELERLARKASNDARAIVYSDVASLIERENPCVIRFYPSPRHEFAGKAQTWTRVINVHTTWPGERTYFLPEHWIFYDSRLPRGTAARLIAHELYHIWKHNPLDPKWEVDTETKRVLYTEQEEREADMFALCLLKYRPYYGGGKPPLTNEQFIEMVEQETGWPHWLTEDEVREIAEHL